MHLPERARSPLEPEKTGDAPALPLALSNTTSVGVGFDDLSLCTV